jgi:hypothetical protein
MCVLGSAINEFELGAEFRASVEERNDCRGCPVLERMEEIRNRRGRKAVDAMLQGVVRALERHVRANDQVLLRPCGQIDVVLAKADDERSAGSVIQRLQARMKGFWGAHALEISSAVTIREGKSGMTCEPVVRNRTRPARPNEGFGEPALTDR